MFKFSFKEILNLEEHLNQFISSKVTAILVNRGILPRGGVVSGRVCDCSLCSRLVFLHDFYCPISMLTHILHPVYSRYVGGPQEDQNIPKTGLKRPDKAW